MLAADTDVLIFVEDPGAANLIVDLPSALSAEGHRGRVLATGDAAPYLRSAGAEFDELELGRKVAEIIEAYAPRLIVVGTSENPETSGLKLVAQARQQGIASVGLVDGPANTEHRFRGPANNPLAYAPDWIVVPNEATYSRYEAHGHPGNRIVVCGHPYFDRIRDAAHRLRGRPRAKVRDSILPGAPTDRSIWVFVAELSDGLDPKQFRRHEGYTLVGRGSSDKRTDVVLEEVLDAVNRIAPRPYFVLRLHPKNGLQEFTAYKNEIDYVSAGGLPEELMHAADLVIGLTSILLTEAVIMGRPALSVVPDPTEREWLIDDSLFPVVYDRDRLLDALETAAVDPSLLMGTPVEDVIMFGATERLTVFLAKLLRDTTAGEG